MRFTSESAHRPCGCRLVVECHHDLFDEEKSLDMLVNAFSDAMRAKLRRKILAGYKGWDAPSWTREQIVAALKEHLDKGDPVDVANFAAFIWNRE